MGRWRRESERKKNRKVFFLNLTAQFLFTHLRVAIAIAVKERKILYNAMFNEEGGELSLFLHNKEKRTIFAPK